MTREEAIAYFERHIDLYCVTGICREAEEMAIAALKQQPCGDLISKADTLKAMSNTWSHICYVARRKKPTKGEEAVYSDMVGTVKNLPLVTAEPCEGWYDVFSDEMTLEQARQAVKDLRKKLAEYLDQEPCPDTISRSDMLDAVGHGMTYTSEDLQKIIKGLPPVNPQKNIVNNGTMNITL